MVNVILSYVIFVSRLAQLPLSKGGDCCLSSPVAIMVVPSLATTCLSHSTPLHLRHRLLPSDPLLILPPELTMKFLSFLLIFVHLGPRSDPGPSCHSPPCSDPESRGYLQHFLSSDTLLLFNYHICHTFLAWDIFPNLALKHVS